MRSISPMPSLISRIIQSKRGYVRSRKIGRGAAHIVKVAPGSAGVLACLLPKRADCEGKGHLRKTDRRGRLRSQADSLACLLPKKADCEGKGHLRKTTGDDALAPTQTSLPACFPRGAVGKEKGTSARLGGEEGWAPRQNTFPGVFR